MHKRNRKVKDRLNDKPFENLEITYKVCAGTSTSGTTSMPLSAAYFTILERSSRVYMNVSWLCEADEEGSEARNAPRRANWERGRPSISSSSTGKDCINHNAQ